MSLIDSPVLLYDLFQAFFEIYYQVFDLLILFHPFEKYIFMDLVDQFLEDVDSILKLIGAAIVEAFIV